MHYVYYAHSPNFYVHESPSSSPPQPLFSIMAFVADQTSPRGPPATRVAMGRFPQLLPLLCINMVVEHALEG